MNCDDPKLTAYALSELDPKDAGEIREMLEANKAASAEVDSTIALAATLRAHLQAEPAVELTETDRAEIFQAAREWAQVSPKIVPIWRRPSVLSAMAACLVVGLSIGLLFPAVSAKMRSGPPIAVRPSLPAPAFNIAMGESAAAPGDNAATPDLASSTIASRATTPYLPARPIPAIPAELNPNRGKLSIPAPQLATRAVTEPFTASAPTSAGPPIALNSPKRPAGSATSKATPQRKRAVPAPAIVNELASTKPTNSQSDWGQTGKGIAFAETSVATIPFVRVAEQPLLSVSVADQAPPMKIKESIAPVLNAEPCPWAPGNRLVRFAFQPQFSGTRINALQVEFNPDRVSEYRLIGVDRRNPGLLSALFEIVPTAKSTGSPSEPLKYQPSRPATHSLELLTVRVPSADARGGKPAVREFSLSESASR